MAISAWFFSKPPAASKSVLEDLRSVEKVAKNVKEMTNPEK
jgi:hypothetical protein